MTNAPLTGLEMKTPATADPAAAKIMNAAQQQFGFSPNMYGFMAVLPAVLTIYDGGYGAFRTEAGFSPLEQEVVFLTISHANQCHYCTAAHSMVAEHASGVPADVLANLRAGDVPADSKLAALVTLTKSMVETRGRPDAATLNAFLAAGYRNDHVLGIVLAISVKVLSNYTNYLAQTELDDAFKPFAV